MKVIFLDIDGVLNTPSSESRCGEYIGIDDDKLVGLTNVKSESGNRAYFYLEKVLAKRG